MKYLAILVRDPFTSAPVSASHLQRDSCMCLCCELDQRTDPLLKKKSGRFLKASSANQSVSGYVLANSCLDWGGVGRRWLVSGRGAKNTLNWYCFQTLRCDFTKQSLLGNRCAFSIIFGWFLPLQSSMWKTCPNKEPDSDWSYTDCQMHGVTKGTSLQSILK